MLNGWDDAIKSLRDAALQNRHRPEALDAIEEIGRIGGPQACDALIELLVTQLDVPKRQAWELRVLRSLGDVGDDRAVELMLDFTGPGNSMVCTVAIDGIGRIGGPVAAEALRYLRKQRGVRTMMRFMGMRPAEPGRTLGLRALAWLQVDLHDDGDVPE